MDTRACALLHEYLRWLLPDVEILACTMVQKSASRLEATIDVRGPISSFRVKCEQSKSSVMLDFSPRHLADHVAPRIRDYLAEDQRKHDAAIKEDWERDTPF